MNKTKFKIVENNFHLYMEDKELNRQVNTTLSKLQALREICKCSVRKLVDNKTTQCLTCSQLHTEGVTHVNGTMVY